ncbi:MAG: glycosyltransferase [Stellaceae bacterium]
MSGNPTPLLSALVVARDEEGQLADCLDTLAFADEIVVVLDRSTDRSREIARRYTDRIVEGAWEHEGPRRALPQGSQGLGHRARSSRRDALGYRGAGARRPPRPSRRSRYFRHAAPARPLYQSARRTCANRARSAASDTTCAASSRTSGSAMSAGAVIARDYGAF